MRLGILASWRGTNFKAIVDHIRLGVLRGVDIALLIYSDQDAPVRKIAEEYGIESLFIKHKGVPRPKREEEIAQALRDSGVDYVALAGYDYILGRAVLEKFKWRVLNIHPSLLPFAGGKGMYGLRVHMEVYKSGARVTGPTVHLVDESVDGGPILDQWPVYIGDIYALELPYERKIELIADRVLIYEHRLYSRVLQAVADGLLDIYREVVKVPTVVEENNRVIYREEEREVWRARLRYTRQWLEEWGERQRAYIELQLREWSNAGKDLGVILGYGRLD